MAVQASDSNLYKSNSKLLKPSLLHQKVSITSYSTHLCCWFTKGRNSCERCRSPIIKLAWQPIFIDTMWWSKAKTWKPVNKRSLCFQANQICKIPGTAPETICISWMKMTKILVSYCLLSMHITSTTPRRVRIHPSKNWGFVLGTYCSLHTVHGGVISLMVCPHPYRQKLMKTILA